MDFRQLKYFVAVAEAGSMSGAARTLFVTQPTLTVAIQKLEKSLGAQLLDRSTTPLSLTPAGRALVDGGAPILQELERLSAHVRSLGSEDTQRIRIGLTVLFSMQFMPQITRFMASHPDVEVSLVQSGSRAMQKEIADGQLDIGVVSFPCYEPNLEITPLPGDYGTYTVAAVMCDDHPLASRTSVTYADLAGQAFSSLSDNYVLGEMLHERCQEAGFTPNVQFTNDSWNVLLSSILDLGTIGLLPMQLSELTALKGLAWVPLDDRVSHLPIGIAMQKDRPRPKALTELITALRS